VVDFYDGLAADYHLVYGHRWDDAVASQGAALDAVIRGARPDACTCADRAGELGAWRSLSTS
jgi:hypothetical protein